MNANRAAGLEKPEARRAENPLAAILWALGAAAAASLLMALPKLGAAGMHPLAVTFIRYGAGLAIVVPLAAAAPLVPARWSGAAGRPRTPVPIWMHLLRAAMAAARITCIVVAVTLMPLANAQAIVLTNGIFMVLFAALILREKVDGAILVLALIGLAGGIAAAEPDIATPASFLSPGALLAFAAAILFGLESVIIRYSALREGPVRTLFYVNAGAAALLLVPALWLWREGIPAWQYAIVALMGPAAIATQACNIQAFARARAAILVPVRYVSIIFGIALGFALFGETPSAQALAGMALIAVAGIATAVLSAPRRRTAPATPSV